MMAFEPCSVQCIPARFSRMPIATLQPASTTPGEVPGLFGAVGVTAQRPQQNPACGPERSSSIPECRSRVKKQ